MKKTALIICAAFLALVSCNKQLTAPDEGNAAATEITFNLDATHPDGGDTKAVKTGWEKDDVIFVFFNNVAAPKYLKMIYTGTAWTNVQMNGATEESLGLTDSSTGTMTAVYLPFGSGATVSADGTDFKFSETYLSYYLTAQLTYNVSGGEVSGTFDMRIPDGYVQFFLDDTSADPATEMELREHHLMPQGIASIDKNGTISHTNIAHGAPLPGYVYDKKNKLSGENKGWLFSGILESESQNTKLDYNFTLVSGTWVNGTYYTKSFKDKTLYTSNTSGRALKLPALSDWTVSGYRAIDLGCDMEVGGVKRRLYWSDRNLGAAQYLPESSNIADLQKTWGDYYAWGEVEPYYNSGHAYDSPMADSNWREGKTAGYAWGSYRFNPSGDGETFSFYNEGSTYNFLFPEDDAAYRLLGGSWRMPTEKEFAVLMDPNKFIWENHHDDLGGWVVFSNITGYTTRLIFIPGAGVRTGNTLHDIGYGKYWSSTFRDSGNTTHLYNAYELYTSSTKYEGAWENRKNGYPIRPVMD